MFSNPLQCTRLIKNKLLKSKTMKQKLYILGIINLLVILTGAIFKVSHITGAGILISSGIFLLLFIFLPFTLINNYKTEGNRKNVLLYIITWVTCIIVFGSMLFKIMHWPGAGIFLLLALPFPFVIFLPMYLFATSKIKNYNIYNTVFILFLLVYLAVFSALLALNVSSEKINQSLVLAENYRDMTAFLKKETSIIPDEITGTYYSKVEESAEQLLATINYCKTMLYKNMNSTEDLIYTKGGKIGEIYSRTLAVKALLSGNKDIPAVQLETNIREFIKVLGGTPQGNALKAYATEMLLFKKNDISGLSWGKQMFENEYLSWVLIYLESMESNVLILKNYALLSGELSD
jgi:hypothetical protein